MGAPAKDDDGSKAKFRWNLVSGALAGAISRTLTAPIERVKVVLQVQAVARVPEAQQYKGILDCLVRLPQEQGVFAYWRGNGLNVTRIIPNSAIKFATFRLYTTLAFPKGVDQYEGWERFRRNVYCGAMSGFSTIVVVYPLDLARTRISADTHGEYRGVNHMLRYTISKQGLSGLYSGLPISLCGIMPYFAIMFATFDYFKVLTAGNTFFDSTIGRCILGSCAGLFSQSVTYPFDTVRRHMQVSGGLGQRRAYNNAWECIKTIYATHGWRGYYKGLLANASRAAPQAGIEFACFDLFASLIVETSAEVEESFAQTLQKESPKVSSEAPLASAAFVRRMSSRLCNKDVEAIVSIYRSLEGRNGIVTREDLMEELLVSGYKDRQVHIIMSFLQDDVPIDYLKFREMCKDKQVLEMLNQNRSCE